LKNNKWENYEKGKITTIERKRTKIMIETFRNSWKFWRKKKKIIRDKDTGILEF
jgi:hypothetical protein